MPILKGNKVVLRPLKSDDSTLFYQWRNQVDYIKNTKSFRLPKTEGMEKEWVETVMLDKSDRAVILIIEVENTSIGFIQLSNIDWLSRNCYFGIAICEEAMKGKGFGREAIKLILDYAFGNINLHKVSLEVTAFNKNSIRIYESLGFNEEGVLREHYYWNNQYHDVHLYGLLKEEYIHGRDQNK